MIGDYARPMHHINNPFELQSNHETNKLSVFCSTNNIYAKYVKQFLPPLWLTSARLPCSWSINIMLYIHINLKCNSLSPIFHRIIWKLNFCLLLPTRELIILILTPYFRSSLHLSFSPPQINLPLWFACVLVCIDTKPQNYATTQLYNNIMQLISHPTTPTTRSLSSKLETPKEVPSTSGTM